MTNDTITELTELQGQRKQLELQAQQNEQAARDCRAKMAEAKQREAELRATINDGAIVEAVTSSLALAKAAQGTVEAANVEIGKVLESLKLKETQLDAKVANVDDKLEEVSEAMEKWRELTAAKTTDGEVTVVREV